MVVHDPLRLNFLPDGPPTVDAYEGTDDGNDKEQDNTDPKEEEDTYRPASWQESAATGIQVCLASIGFFVMWHMYTVFTARSKQATEAEAKAAEAKVTGRGVFDNYIKQALEAYLITVKDGIGGDEQVVHPSDNTRYTGSKRGGFQWQLYHHQQQQQPLQQPPLQQQPIGSSAPPPIMVTMMSPSHGENRPPPSQQLPRKEQPAPSDKEQPEASQDNKQPSPAARFSKPAPPPPTTEPPSSKEEPLSQEGTAPPKSADQPTTTQQ